MGVVSANDWRRERRINSQQLRQHALSFSHSSLELGPIWSFKEYNFIVKRCETDVSKQRIAAHSRLSQEFHLKLLKNSSGYIISLGHPKYLNIHFVHVAGEAELSESCRGFRKPARKNAPWKLDTAWELVANGCVPKPGIPGEHRYSILIYPM